MKSLTCGSRTVANLDLARIDLVRTLSGFELSSSVEGQTTPGDTSHWFVAHSGQVHVGREQGEPSRIGVGRLALPGRIRTGKFAMTVSWDFRLPLTSQDLVAIEDLRAGADLKFKLVISGEGGPEDHPDQILPAHDDFWRSLGRSDWIRALESAKAMDILLLEIPMPLVAPSKENRAVIEELRRAQRMFVEGVGSRLKSSLAIRVSPAIRPIKAYAYQEPLTPVTGSILIH